MKEYDYVKLTAEKDKYAKYDVHKDMVGWICDPRVIDDCRLVCFDHNDLDDYPIIAVKINDLELVWEAPVRGIGQRVIMASSDYERLGVSKGDLGIITEKGADNEHWLVAFDRGSVAEIKDEHLYINNEND
ncbi:MAG: hypothetical protein NC037_05840 [Bacteroides sp.]|nr:hypothetical protein [Bacillota bacterium]MCM1456027.1 hypothetical protein [Bacteroides sp.]